MEVGTIQIVFSSHFPINIIPIEFERISAINIYLRRKQFSTPFALPRSLRALKHTHTHTHTRIFLHCVFGFDMNECVVFIKETRR